MPAVRTLAFAAFPLRDNSTVIVFKLKQKQLYNPNYLPFSCDTNCVGWLDEALWRVWRVIDFVDWDLIGSWSVADSLGSEGLSSMRLGTHLHLPVQLGCLWIIVAAGSLHVLPLDHSCLNLGTVTVEEEIRPDLFPSLRNCYFHIFHPCLGMLTDLIAQKIDFILELSWWSSNDSLRTFKNNLLAC